MGATLEAGGDPASSNRQAWSTGGVPAGAVAGWLELCGSLAVAAREPVEVWGGVNERERRVVGRVTTALAWAREATAAGALLVPADAPWTQAAVVQQRHRERLGLAGRCEHLGDGPEVEGRLMLVDLGDAVGGHGSSVYPRPGVVIRRAGLAGSTSSLRRSWAA